MDNASPQHIERLDVSFHYFGDHPEGYAACVCYFPVVKVESGGQEFLRDLYGSQMLMWSEVPAGIQTQLLRLRDLVIAEVVPVLNVEIDGKVLPPPTAKIVEIEVLSGGVMQVKFRMPTAEALSNRVVEISTLSENIRLLEASIRKDFGVVAREHFTTRLSGSAVTTTADRFKPPLRFFYSFSHRDDRLMASLEEHLSLLRRERLVSTWHFRKLAAGTEWEVEIDENLDAAHVILLLVSSSFLASDYCYSNEMKRAMEKHERGEARVVPVILRPVDWHSAPFGKLQALPRDGKAVTTWENRDLAWVNVAGGLRNIVRELTEPRK